MKHERGNLRADTLRMPVAAGLSWVLRLRHRLASSRSIVAAGLLVLFTTAGCREAKGPAPVRDATNGASPAAATAQPLPSPPPPSQSPVSPPLATPFHPVPLDDFYQRQFVDYRPTESWAQVPRGETNFDGAPFLMFGKIDLTGLGRARDGEFHPPRVGEIPVGHNATKVHLIHGASYDAPDGTPVACLLLRYENGEARRLFIRYGVQVRNWYVEARETDPTLSDARSVVIWNGHTRPDGAGTPTRLFKSTYDNPLPAQAIRSIELLSLFGRANSVILAITLEESPEAALATSEDEDDSQFRREDLVRVLDADTSQPIPGATVRLSVTERARKYRFGDYRNDGRGIRVMYPPGIFQAFLLDVSAPGYLPANHEIASDDGILGPDVTVSLKRAAAP